MIDPYAIYEFSACQPTSDFWLLERGTDGRDVYYWTSLADWQIYNAGHDVTAKRWSYQHLPGAYNSLHNRRVERYADEIGIRGTQP
jgi:hypothetical protein